MLNAGLCESDEHGSGAGPSIVGRNAEGKCRVTSEKVARKVPLLEPTNRADE